MEGLKHGIWEIALHIAYWEYAVQRLLVGGPRGGFPRSPSNWPALPDRLSEHAWRKDRSLVAIQRDALIDAIRGGDANRLSAPASSRSKRSVEELLVEVVRHSAYHTGQISLLKRIKSGGLVQNALLGSTKGEEK